MRMVRPPRVLIASCALLFAGCGAPSDADRIGVDPAGAAPAERSATPMRSADGDKPANRVVTDLALRTLLTHEYGEAVMLDAAWPADPEHVEAGRDGVPLDRRICADSGVGDPRWIAICTRYGGDEAIGAPADVDLLRVRARSADGAPGLWIDLQSTGIDSGADGTPGRVEWLKLGRERRAFAVHAREQTAGRELAAHVTLYGPEDGGFGAWLRVATLRANPGACDPDADAACADSLYSVECTLRVGPEADAAGDHPLMLEIRGDRGGARIERDLTLQRTAGGYALPEPSACDP